MQNCGQKIIGRHKAERNPTLKTTQTRCEKRKGETDGQDKKTGKENGKEKQSMRERNQEIMQERGENV